MIDKQPGDKPVSPKTALLFVLLPVAIVPVIICLLLFTATGGALNMLFSFMLLVSPLSVLIGIVLAHGIRAQYGESKPGQTTLALLLGYGSFLLVIVLAIVFTNMLVTNLRG